MVMANVVRVYLLPKYTHQIWIGYIIYSIFSPLKVYIYMHDMHIGGMQFLKIIPYSYLWIYAKYVCTKERGQKCMSKI
jgi:hypothetical protein